MSSTNIPAIKIDSPNIINHVLLSISLSTPIILSSTIDKVVFGKNSKLPSLSRGDIVSLCFLTTALTYTIDYLQTYGYMSERIIFRPKSEYIIFRHRP